MPGINPSVGKNLGPVSVSTPYNKKQNRDAKYSSIKATKSNPNVTTKSLAVKEHKLLYSNHHANNNNNNKLVTVL